MQICSNCSFIKSITSSIGESALRMRQTQYKKSFVLRKEKEKMTTEVRQSLCFIKARQQSRMSNAWKQYYWSTFHQQGPISWNLMKSSFHFISSRLTEKKIGSDVCFQRNMAESSGELMEKISFEAGVKLFWRFYWGDVCFGIAIGTKKMVLLRSKRGRKGRRGRPGPRLRRNLRARAKAQ